MAKGIKTGGRQKGTPNKTTAGAKEAIEEVAIGLGGAEGMLRWAQSSDVNERVFWSNIYPRILPKEIKAEHTGADGSPLQHDLTMTVVFKTP